MILPWTSTDIYALGWVLWEITSRKIPFEDEKHAVDATIINWITKGDREAIPITTPPKYGQLLSHCWAQRNEDRPQSVREIAKKLESIDAPDDSVQASGYQYYSR